VPAYLIDRLFSTGLGILLFVLLWRRRDQVGRLQAALIVLVLAGLASGAAFLTGIPAEVAVEGLPGVGEHTIHEHHATALAALIASLATGVLAGVALARSRGPGVVSSSPWFAWLGMISLAALLILGWASNLGALIRHAEIR
jgi:peptidoglycan/LPS O-acetylase OafA/YrhL